MDPVKGRGRGRAILIYLGLAESTDPSHNEHKVVPPTTPKLETAKSPVEGQFDNVETELSGKVVPPTTPKLETTKSPVEGQFDNVETELSGKDVFQVASTTNEPPEQVPSSRTALPVSRSQDSSCTPLVIGGRGRGQDKILAQLATLGFSDEQAPASTRRGGLDSGLEHKSRPHETGGSRGRGRGREKLLELLLASATDNPTKLATACTSQVETNEASSASSWVPANYSQWGRLLERKTEPPTQFTVDTNQASSASSWVPANYTQWGRGPERMTEPPTQFTVETNQASSASSRVPANDTQWGRGREKMTEPNTTPTQFTVETNQASSASSRVPANDTQWGRGRERTTEPNTTPNAAHLSQEDLDEMLRWFRQPTTKAVTIEYLNRLLNEPIGDTDSLIDALSPLCSYIRRCILQLALVRIALDQGQKSEAVGILNGILKDTPPDQAVQIDCERELLEAIKFWLKVIRSQICTSNGNKLSLVPPPLWSTMYLKAAFLSIFSRPGCLKALNELESVAHEDNPSMQNLELQFLMARVLGKLRYYEQWPASKWQKEEAILSYLLEHLEPSSRFATRVQVYLAEFLRLRAYRRFIETRNDEQAYTRACLMMREEYARTFTVLKALFEPLKKWSPVEGLAWHTEQFFKMPNLADEDDDIFEELGQQSMEDALFLKNFNCAYLQRVAALQLEKIGRRRDRQEQNEMKQCKMKVPKQKEAAKDKELTEYLNAALEYLNLAVKLGSTIAQVERASLIFRMEPTRNMLPIMQKLPDSRLHVASYLTLCTNNQEECNDLIQTYLLHWESYPPLLVHYPATHYLVEPVNLLDVVSAGGYTPPAGYRGYLTHRQEIIQESHRLRSNRMYRSDGYTRRKPKKKLPQGKKPN